MGNHEYLTPNASGYYGYFGAAAGDPTQGYYSYDLGAWHVVVLNSNCSKAGGCGRARPRSSGSRPTWRPTRRKCTLAYWHHPRWSNGEHGDQPQVAPLWTDLYDAGADLVLAGHDHDYERFEPLDGNGNPDPQRGIREFVVGTGGKNYYALNAISRIPASRGGPTCLACSSWSCTRTGTTGSSSRSREKPFPTRGRECAIRTVDGNWALGQLGNQEFSLTWLPSCLIAIIPKRPSPISTLVYSSF